MDNKHLEPAAFPFPLPSDLKEQYMKWFRSSQPSPGKAKVQGNPLGVNPFILFLILILLLLGTRKEQILAVIRKLLLEPEKKPKKA